MKKTITERRPNTTELLPLEDYDYFICSFSGGKDSLAQVLDLIGRGVPKEKIELWHQEVDGGPDAERFMDWPVTADYCRKVAAHLGVNLYFQWRDGGILRELLKENSQAAPITFENPDGTKTTLTSDRSKVATRRRWPAKSANLMVRWCSSAVKISVASRALNNSARFVGKKVLYLSGERREESSARAKYAELEKHTCSTLKRRVDHWRSIIDWTEAKVWETIRDAGIIPHPAYRLGWGRLSCMSCIFGSPDQWASVRSLAPSQFERIAKLEKELDHTIDAKKTVVEMADKGESYIEGQPEDLKRLAMSADYTIGVTGGKWTIPSGAFKSCGAPS